MDTILRLSANSSYLLGAFVIIAALLHVLLVYAFPLTKIGWKRVDYIWLIVGLLGLLGAIDKARIAIAKIDVEYHKAHAQLMFSTFDSALATEEFVANSPTAPGNPPLADFDERQAQREVAAQWLTEQRKQIPPNSEISLPEIEWTRPMPDAAKPFYEAEERSLNEHLANYRKARNGFKATESATRPSKEQTGLEILAPPLLAFAFALRITKVTGEIKLERSKNV